MQKRLIALVLAIAMVISTLPASALAEEPESGQEPIPAATEISQEEPATEPETEPATEPATEPVAEPATEPETEPATEPEPTAEPVTEPVTEPETEPVTEPTKEPEQTELVIEGVHEGYVGDQFQLNVHYGDGTVPETVTWESTDKSIVAIEEREDGFFAILLAPGTAEIIAKDGNGLTGRFAIAVLETVTEAPTEEATEAPTEEATEVPTEAPTEEATELPTEAPIEETTEVPTEEGTSAADATTSDLREIQADFSESLNLQPNEKVSYSFTPEEDGRYVFYEGISENRVFFTFEAKENGQSIESGSSRVEFDAKAGHTYELVVSNNYSFTDTIHPTLKKAVAPTKISLSADSISAFVGESKSLGVTIEPRNAMWTRITCEIDNEDVVSGTVGLLHDIYLSCKKAGIAVTTVKMGDCAASCTINVSAVSAATPISIGSPIEIESGNQYAFAFTAPETGDYCFLADENVPISISYSGAVNGVHWGRNALCVGISGGQTVIFKPLLNGQNNANIWMDYCVPVESIELQNCAEQLFVGDTTSPSVTYAPRNSILEGATWSSSNPDVLRLDRNQFNPSFQFTAVAGGEADIIVTTVNGLTASKTVRVIAPTQLTLGQPVELEQEIGEHVFSFTAPESRTYVVYEKNSSYASPNVEVFDKAGHIQKRISDCAVSFDAQAGESYQIKVSLQGTNIRTICLEEFSELTGLRVKNFYVATSFAGTTGNFSLQLEPTPTYAALGTVTYSIANPEIAEITNGMWGGKALRLLKAGTTELIATVENGASASVPITVKAPTAIHPGESVPFTVAYTRPFAVQYTAETAGEYCFRTESGEGSNESFYKNFEKLDPYYIDTFERLYLDAGDTIVAVIQTGYENYSDVLFFDRCIEPTQITLDKTSIDAAVGSSHYLSIDMQPINANRDVVWESSDPEVAEVEKSLVPFGDCYVKAKKAGSAVITATVGSISASCVVTVSDPEEIQPGFSREVEIQDEVRFRFVAPKAAQYRFWVEGYPNHINISTILEENYKPGDSPYTSPGNPFNTQEGAAYIILVRNYNDSPSTKATLHLDECVPLQSLELVANGDTFDVGGIVLVKITPHPENADEVGWLTAEIDGDCMELQRKVLNEFNGYTARVATAIKPGTATLTITSESGISASIPLTVRENEAITVGDAREVTLQPGEQLRYSFAVEQEGCYVFHDAANTWSPLQFSIYYVEYSARIAAGQGRAEYIAQPGLKLTLVVENPTDSPITTRIALEEEAALSSILLSKEEITCAAGSTLTVRANTEPGNAPMSNLRWSVDDSSVASIIDKQAGNVTLACEKAGTAVLTATIGDVTASCIIHVTSQQTPIASGTCGENLTWTLTEDGTLTISGTGDMTNYLRPEIPWYSYRSQIVSVFIESGVTSIGDCAFDGCGDLTSIAIPDGVTSIGAGAFENCSSLTSLTIPSSVVSIGNWAFYRCSGLASITIPDNVTNIGDCAFYQCSSLTSLTIPNSVTSIGYGMFDSCSGLTSVTIPNSVTSIGKRAFYGCSSLASITIPDSVTAIGDCAFTGCSSLTSAAIPDGVTQICSEAFYGCSSLVSVTIPNSATTIGSNAFGLCSSLSNVTIPDSVTDIGGWAFDGCSSLDSVTIPESVTSIGIYAFLRCSSLTDVYFGGTTEEQWNRISVADGNEALLNATIHYHTTVASGTCGKNLTWTLTEDGTLTLSGTGDMAGYNWNSLSEVPWYPYRSQIVSASIEPGVTSIGSYVFYECSDLASVTIPDSVTTIGSYAFYECSNLISVTIPDSVTTIGGGAFGRCSSLSKVTIPDSVTTIGNFAFSGCSSLINVSIPNSVTSIGYGTFESCSNLVSVSIPEGVTSIGNRAFLGCSSLISVTIPNSVTGIGNSAFSECSNLTNVSILEGVTVIGEWAFSGCSSLTSVSIPEGVAVIGKCVFRSCKSLTSVIIPDSVTSIGESAFWWCSSLTSVSIPSSVTSIDNNAFAHCRSLTSVVIPEGVTNIGDYAFDECNNLTSVSIPSSVTSIGIYAFQFCSNLTSVSIAEGVTNIGEGIFYRCSSLTSVSIPDSVTSIGENVFYGCSSLTSVSIPSSVTSIGIYAFQYCINLDSVSIAEGVTSIGEGAFYKCSSLTSVVIPDSVTTIGICAFQYCSSLISVTIPDSVTAIDYSAFRGCESLTSITIPDSVTTIGNEAFYGCSNLTGVVIPDSVTTIGNEAFWACSKLADVYFGGTEEQRNQISVADGNDPLLNATIHYNATHICTLIEIPAKAPTTTEDGNYQYWICSICGKAYKDALGKVETTVEAETIRIKPAVTTLTKVTGGDGSFTAAWNIQKNVDGYAMQYATNSSFASCKTVMVYGGDVTSTTVKNLTAGTYYVRVRTFKTVDGDKSYSLASPALTVTVRPFRPDATMLTKVTGDKGCFTADWNIQENVDGYALQYATNSSFTSCVTVIVHGGSTASATVDGLNAGSYYVRVRTFKTAGSSKTYSLASTAMTVTVASTKPDATTLMKVTGGEGSFTAAWDSRKNVDGYAVQYATNSSFASCKTVMVYDGDVSSTTVKDLAAGTYYVRVRTFTTAGSSKTYSLASPALTVTVLAVKPTATTLANVTGNEGSFTATWDSQENVDGYAVQYTTNSSFTSCRTSMVYGNNTTSATVNSLNAGTYYVRVRTFRIVGSSKIYSLASNSLTVTVASTKPAAPMLMKVTGGEGSFTAAWNAQTNVAGYAVQYATNSSFASCKTLMVYDGDTTSITAKDLNAGTYYVRVRAFKAVGSSKTYSLPSSTMSVTVNAVKPAATTLTKVTGDKGSFTATWDPQENVDGYAVQYATNSSFTSCRTSMVYGASATSATVNSLNAGTYYVRVRTFRIVGSSKIYSLASNSLTVSVASTRPAATMLTKVIGGEGSFTATWNAQKDVDGYAVQYATNSSFTSCATLMVDDASTASATVSGLPAGTYYVRVRTFTTAGNSKSYSLASNALTVTVRVAKPTATVLTKVTAEDSSFTAAWNAKQNVDGYAVQYATDSGFASCKTVMVYGGGTTSKAVKNLPAGTYYVRVRTFKTVDGAKNYSLASAYLTVTVK